VRAAKARPSRTAAARARMRRAWDGSPPVPGGERPDDPARLARRPTGLIGGAGSEAPAEPDPGPGGLGSALDTARQERAAARAELQRFGLRQQKQDPEGFRAARERAAAADEALRRAQAAYERAMTGGRNEVGFSALQRGG
jgi:hypothetical protein